MTEAFTLLEKAVELKPNHEPARLALAKLYLEGSQYLSTPPPIFYDKVPRIAHGYLQTDPKSFHGHRLLGHLALLDSKPAEAATHFRAALAVQPESTEVATLFTQSLLANKNVAEAEAFAQKTLAASPANGALSDILYFPYRSTNRPREAEGLLLSARPLPIRGIACLSCNSPATIKVSGKPRRWPRPWPSSPLVPTPMAC